MRINKYGTLIFTAISGIILYIAKFLLPIGFLVDYVSFSIFVLGYDILFGYTGWVSLGHILYYGVGVYTFALFTKYVNVNPVIGLLVVLIAGASMGLMLAPIVLRSGGVYFAFINLAFAAVAYWLVIVPFKEFTGGFDGMELTFSDTFLISFKDIQQYYVVLLVIFVLFLALYKKFTRSAFCYLLRAINENETKVKFCGYDTFRIRMIAFTLSTTLSAFAGALRCIYIGYVNPDFISPTRIGDAPFACLIGGAGTFYGPLIGSLIMTGLKDILCIYFGGRWEIFLGVLVILIVWLAPKGIFNLIMEKLEKLRGE